MLFYSIMNLKQTVFNCNNCALLAHIVVIVISSIMTTTPIHISTSINNNYSITRNSTIFSLLLNRLGDGSHGNVLRTFIRIFVIQKRRKPFWKDLFDLWIAFASRVLLTVLYAKWLMTFLGTQSFQVNINRITLCMPLPNVSTAKYIWKSHCNRTLYGLDATHKYWWSWTYNKNDTHTHTQHTPILE